ncbi:MAG TPA: DNA translocase FtsK 4TM domain-containing protein, partial [Candidatus Binatia bacterium]|nr:DNA translocase FtsK 4TM domain-containing protein [Candidatus Binatia bacterium]
MADAGSDTRPLGDRPNERPRRASRRRDARRWVREAEAIVLLAAAGFTFVALGTFDPALAPGEQDGLVGPVGTWLGWVLFRGFGYAGYLFPTLLAVLALAVFLRPRLGRGWPPAVGLTVLILVATGLLAHVGGLVESGATRHAPGPGGVVGWAVAGVLRAALGDVGTWIVLLAGVPVGVLFLTQVSYGALTRAVSGRWARWRKARIARPRP